MLWTRWLALLLCWGATSGEPKADEMTATPAGVRSDSRRQRSPPPVEPLDFGYVPAAVYDTHAYYEPGAIGILFHVVHAFLYAVQPHSFPKGERICFYFLGRGREMIASSLLVFTFNSLYLGKGNE